MNDDDEDEEEVKGALQDPRKSLVKPFEFFGVKGFGFTKENGERAACWRALQLQGHIAATHARSRMPPAILPTLAAPCCSLLLQSCSLAARRSLASPPR